jgi:hypothetical protein
LLFIAFGLVCFWLGLSSLVDPGSWQFGTEHGGLVVPVVALGDRAASIVFLLLGALFAPTRRLQ